MWPLSYMGEIEVHLPENRSDEIVMAKIKEAFQNENGGPNDSDIKVDALFGLPTKIDFSTESTYQYDSIKYRIDLFEICLVSMSIMLAGLFLRLATTSSGIGLFALGLCYYLANLLVVNAKVTRTINSITNRLQNQDDGDLWELQKKWMESPNLCPACGEPENPYSKYCTACGIKIKDKKEKPSNSTATQKQSFHYQYKKDNA